MRMWMIHPSLLCRKHLLGEHNELHKHRHVFEKGYSITGRLSPVVQIEPASMKSRHDNLVEEMLKRGFNHRSPFVQPDLSHLSPEKRDIKVDFNKSMDDLANRCEDCACKIRKFLETMDELEKL